MVLSKHFGSKFEKNKLYVNHNASKSSRLQCKKLIIKLNGKNLERVESMKFLGVTRVSSRRVILK